MATLIIRIEESRREGDEAHEICGFSIYEKYEGELAVGAFLPGIKPVLLRAIQNTLDMLYGEPVSVSVESIEDARKRAFIN